jgi:hypothetical protein
MSNSDAIAAVTATLMDLLRDMSDIGGADVSAQPPDKAAEGLQEGEGRVNIFLYQTSVNAAWSNTDPPQRVKPGERGFPPLALNLHYLVTVYTADNNPTLGQRLMGRAMSILHDNAVLKRDRIAQVSPNGDLHQQVESVRITPQPLSLDEISKLWAAFQTQYRTSAAYQASVVLIESTRPVKTPLPVLRRGSEDRGVASQPDLIPPFPTLTGLEYPAGQRSLQFREEEIAPGQVRIVGDELTLSGHHLDGEGVRVHFMHPRLPEAIEAAPQPGGSATTIVVKLSETPDALTTYPAGVYRLAVVVTKTEEGKQVTRTSNELAARLAPRVSIPQNPIQDHTLTLRLSPQVWPEQGVALLLGSAEIPSQARPDPTDTLTFNLAGIPAGEYLVRLRVDGVDSLPVKDYQARPPAFDEEQMVTVHE